MGKITSIIIILLLLALIGGVWYIAVNGVQITIIHEVNGKVEVDDLEVILPDTNLDIKDFLPEIKGWSNEV